jgi:hypothetical protein
MNCVFAPPIASRCLWRRQAFITALLACFVFVGTLHAQSGATGSIVGMVTDPQGQPVIGATVWAIRTWAPAPTSDPVAVTTGTALNGMYEALGLVPGSYRICVTADGAGLLDPCAWSTKPPVWNLLSGQIANINIALTRGTFLHLRFDDFNGVAAAAQQSTGRPPIRVRAQSGSGRAVDFFEIARDANGRNFRALIPVGEAVQFAIYADFSVVDQNGLATAGVTIQAPNVTQTPGPVQTPGPIQGPGAVPQEQTIRFSVQ